MVKPAIFISHSAKDSASKHLLNRLFTQLNKKFDVLLDKERLKPGIEWRLELFAWLKRCDGAVILLSKDALQSAWVLQEATILNWRCSYEKNLSVLPIMLPPVTSDDLKEGWFSAVALDRRQAIVSGSADEIVKKVAGTLTASQPERSQVIGADSTSSDVTADQVAAICYKNAGRQTKFLLLRTRNKNNVERWIFPKGWTHRREPLWLSAQLEARKEGGVAGVVNPSALTTFTFWETKKEKIIIQAFALEVESEFDPIQDDRNPHWYSLGEANEKLSLNRTSGRHLKNARELQAVLDKANKHLGGDRK